MPGLGGVPGGLGPCKLFVGSLHVNVLEEDLMDIFKAFGEIDFLNIQKDERGRSQGCGYVQYRE
eukprot:9500941-Pyramimonas_sp.AAC.1